MNDKQLAQQLQTIWHNAYQQLWTKNGPIENELGQGKIFSEVYQAYVKARKLKENNSEASYLPATQEQENNLNNLQTEEDKHLQAQVVENYRQHEQIMLGKEPLDDFSYLEGGYGYSLIKQKLEDPNFNGKLNTYSIYNELFTAATTYLKAKSPAQLSEKEKKIAFIIELNNALADFWKKVSPRVQASQDNQETDDDMGFSLFDMLKNSEDFDVNSPQSLPTIIAMLEAQVQRVSGLLDEYNAWGSFPAIAEVVNSAIQSYQTVINQYNEFCWLELRRIFINRNYRSFIDSSEYLRILEEHGVSANSRNKKLEWELLQAAFSSPVLGDLQDAVNQILETIEDKGDAAKPEEKAWAAAYELADILEERRTLSLSLPSSQVQVVIDSDPKDRLLNLQGKNYGRLNNDVQQAIRSVANKCKVILPATHNAANRQGAPLRTGKQQELQQSKESFWSKYKTPILWTGAIVTAFAVGAALPYILPALGITVAALTTVFVSVVAVSAVLGAAAAVVTSLGIMAGWKAKNVINSSRKLRKTFTSTDAALLEKSKLGAPSNHRYYENENNNDLSEASRNNLSTSNRNRDIPANRDFEAGTSYQPSQGLSYSRSP